MRRDSMHPLKRHPSITPLMRGLLAVVLLLGVCLPVLPVLWGVPTADAADIKTLRSKSQSLQAKRRAMRSKRNQKLRQAGHMTSKIVKNQQRLHAVRRDLLAHQGSLVRTRTELLTLTQELQQTRRETQKLQRDAAKRLRSIYMGSRLNILQIMLESGNLSTFLDRLYYKQRVVASDKNVIQTLGIKTALLSQQQVALASKQIKIDQTIRGIESLRMNYNERLARDKRYRNKLYRDAKYYENAENQLLSESRRIESDIRRLMAGGKKNATVAKSTGIFSWPVVGRVTSNFGYRVHPIHRKRKMHTGLDIAKPRGAAVKASDGGTVIYAGWKGGYGRVVMINHGNRKGKNLVTLYGHLSSTSVSKGRSVSKGQVVGRVGSTGYATGPHLHFEVRRNGTPVNPRAYLR